jgi:hypothetical protein
MKIRPVGAELSHSDGRISSHDEVNNRISNLMKIRPVGAELSHSDGRITSHDEVNNRISNLMKIRPVGAELSHADGLISSHDEANNRFPQFCEGAYKLCVYVFRVILRMNANYFPKKD